MIPKKLSEQLDTLPRTLYAPQDGEKDSTKAYPISLDENGYLKVVTETESATFDITNNELLSQILVQLQIMNLHLHKMTDEIIDEDTIGPMRED